MGSWIQESNTSLQRFTTKWLINNRADRSKYSSCWRGRDARSTSFCSTRSWWVGHLKNIILRNHQWFLGDEEGLHEMGSKTFDTTLMFQSSRLLWRTFGKLQPKIQLDLFVILWLRTRMSRGYTTTIYSANKKQRPGRNQAKRHQSDHESHNWLVRSSSEIVKVFFLSIFYHVVLQSMVHITHTPSPVTFFYSGETSSGNLNVVYDFFTTTHLFTSSI